MHVSMGIWKLKSNMTRLEKKNYFYIQNNFPLIILNKLFPLNLIASKKNYKRMFMTMIHMRVSWNVLSPIEKPLKKEKKTKVMLRVKF